MPADKEKALIVAQLKLADPLEFTKVGNVLYFKGTGLDPGVWTGIDGHTTEYDTGLIQLNAKKFAGKRVKSVKTEHQKSDTDVVGWTTGYKANDKGGVDIEGYIFDSDEILALETMTASGQPIGISPELNAPSEWDATLGWWKAQALDVGAFNFVPNPACKTCWLESTETKNLSGGPVGGVPNQITTQDQPAECIGCALAVKKEGKKGDNRKMGDPGSCPIDLAVTEFKTFLTAEVAKGKSLEESISAYRTLQKTTKETTKETKDDDNEEEEICPKCKKPMSKCTCEKKMAFDEELQEKLLAAAKTVTEFAAAQTLATQARIVNVVKDIGEVDKTFDSKRFLGALGDGNEAAKLSLLMQYKDSIEHYKATLPEVSRELSKPDQSKMDQFAKEMFGVDKFDLDAMAKSIGAVS